MTANLARPSLLLTVLLLGGCAASAPGVSRTADGGPEIASAPAKPVRAAPIPEVEIKAPKREELIGLDAEGLKKALGAATMVRRDLDTEIWQYRTEACVLFLFLYPDDAKAKKPAVRHMDARGEDMDRCLRTVVMHAKRGATG